MDIKILLSFQPQKLPLTPKEVANYLMMSEEARKDFNKDNPGYWAAFDNASSNPPGFFSQLRTALATNQNCVDVLKEESKKPENRNHLTEITRKIKDFYKEMYVGPMIGALPFFTQWKIPSNYGEPVREEVAWAE